jgi:hypothetical protein
MTKGRKTDALIVIPWRFMGYLLELRVFGTLEEQRD